MGLRSLIDRKYRMNRVAIGQGGVARLALCVLALYVADRWFDIPPVFSIPAAFLGALVYGYFAHERSTRRRADLMAAATAAWDDVEAAALDLREAEGEGAPAAIIAEREEAYARRWIDPRSSPSASANITHFTALANPRPDKPTPARFQKLRGDLPMLPPKEKLPGDFSMCRRNAFIINGLNGGRDRD